MRHLSPIATACLLLSFACSSPETPPKSAAGDRPNFVIILADDQGWGDLSVHGNHNLSTPNIDSLATDGALFEHFYVCPVCAPTRAEFLTGRYYPRGGVRGVSTGQERLNIDEHTVAQTFKAAGYVTGAFGKWHNGTQRPYHPNARGFDEFYGFTEGHWGHYFSPELDHNGKLVRGNGYITDDFTDHALEFIAQNREQPFFCYLPYNTPHSPMQVPDEYWDRFKDKELAQRHRDPEIEEVPKTRAALAMVENIDWNVGRVLEKLNELELSDNTIVIYFSDNGPNSWRWNGGMKGRKGSIEEGGLRSPLLVRWPGHIPAGSRVSRIAGAIDLLPTLADLAGIPALSEKPLDGKSLKPLLTGEAGDWPDRQIFSLRGQQVGVRTQKYRLDGDGQLFDIEADPGQHTDVAAAHPEVAEELRAAAKKWGGEVLPNVGEDDRPFPVGYSMSTLLPARDGVQHGGIERSARPPNCSFFTNLTSAKDSITYDVEVAEAGDYEAILHYTCAAGNLGSTIELSFEGSSIQGKVTEANDPPLVGAAEDRTPRGESLVKDFKPMSLGVISLPKARGLMTLKALDVKGKQVADLRYVELVRK